MNLLNFTYILIVITEFCFLSRSAEQTIQCGEWEAFKDEKCYKVLSNKGFQNYNDAKKSCYEIEGSSLVTINSREEQEFLYNLLHSVHEIVNEVWIGAQFIQNVLSWNDNVAVNFTNWANNNPLHETGYECVRMEMVDPNSGKWFTVPCNQNHLVVCQKMQNWLFSYLQKTVMEMRESFENFSKNLENTESRLIDTKSELKITVSELYKANQTINALQNNIKDLRESYVNLTKKLENTETELINTKSELNKAKQDLQTDMIKRITESAPPGTISYFTNRTAPLGWLKANGQSVSRSTYTKLFTTIGTTFGSGDGSTTFTLPDLRGEFIRGWSDGRDVDKGRDVGSFQWGTSIPFAHYVNNGSTLALSSGHMDRWQGFVGQTFDDGYEFDIKSGQTRNGLSIPAISDKWAHEMYYINAPNLGLVTDWTMLKGTRPRNIALLVCIKY